MYFWFIFVSPSTNFPTWGSFTYKPLTNRHLSIVPPHQKKNKKQQKSYLVLKVNFGTIPFNPCSYSIPQPFSFGYSSSNNTWKFLFLHLCPGPSFSSHMKHNPFLNFFCSLASDSFWVAPTSAAKGFMGSTVQNSSPYLLLDCQFAQETHCCI